MIWTLILFKHLYTSISVSSWNFVLVLFSWGPCHKKTDTRQKNKQKNLLLLTDQRSNTVECRLYCFIASATEKEANPEEMLGDYKKGFIWYL